MNRLHYTIFGDPATAAAALAALVGTNAVVNATLNVSGKTMLGSLGVSSRILSITTPAATGSLVGNRFVISDFDSATLELFQSTATNQLRSNIALSLSVNSSATGALDISTDGAVTIPGTLAVTNTSSFQGALEVGKYMSSVGIIISTNEMNFNIDSDNNETTQFFRWATNTATNSGGTELMRLTEAGAVTIPGTLWVGTIGAFVASDKYLVVDSSGNIHKSATGPAS